ncbi:MAG TPA: hypothetical protein VK968_11655 [Roseimicrobium sp.]|nr:hypothetical protein [Roseimicrobium sp.]
MINKILHGLIAALFAFACLGLWGILNLTKIGFTPALTTLPRFTQWCIEMRPILVVMPAIIGAYCIFVWCRKNVPQDAWLKFFAGSMMTLLLLAIPTMFAVCIPMVVFVDKTMAH